MNVEKHKRLGNRTIYSVLIATLMLSAFPSKIYCKDLPVNRLQISLTTITGNSYFQPVYQGNGVNHMNINLVNLRESGLKAGDEIGIFDGNLCVGATTIQETDLSQNLIGLVASANDTLPLHPNGYLPGHPISLKAYCDGKLYALHFELVNGSKSIFIVGGTMFAFVDFKRSSEIGLYFNPIEKSGESIQLTLNRQQMNFYIVKPKRSRLNDTGIAEY